MDLRQVQTFVTVAELGTVTRASEQLHVAQPALSRQIAELEDEFGLKLFDRIGRRLVLSSAGEQLLGECQALLSHSRAIGERASLLRLGDFGLLRVGASPQHIESVFSQFLPRFAQRYPNVEVRVSEGGAAETMRWLEHGEVDVALCLLQSIRLDESRFASQPLALVDMLAACSSSMPLGQRGVIEVGQLATHPLLLLDSGFGFRKAFDAACRLAGAKPDIRFESRSPHTLLTLAEAGHGVAVIPSALRTHRYELRVVAVTYRGKALRELLTVHWDKRRSLPAYAHAFCEMWVRHVKEVFPITRPTENTGDGRRAARTKTVERAPTVVGRPR